MVVLPLTAPVDRPASAPPWTARLLEALPDPAGPLGWEQERVRAALAGMPLPSRREEAWRFTDLSPLTAVAPCLLAAEAPPSLPAAAEGSFRLVLGGSRDPLAGVRLPEGLEALPLPASGDTPGLSLALPDSAPGWPVLLNQAACSRVLALRVRGVVAPVLELVSDAGDGEGVLPLRVLLVLDPGAQLEVLEVHRAAGASLTSLLVQAELGAGARLRHGLLALGGEDASFLAHLAVTQEPASTLEHTAVVSGWGLARLEPCVHQRTGGATTRLLGLQAVDGSRIADTHSQVVFGGPEGTLDQVHKAVADGAGRSVFNGAVRVPREAQRTDAAQLSRTLLLSDRARIDTKPELEIVADDVRCAHGATVSRLQQEELFYLQSRGIDAAKAARLLLRGFCEEVLRELPPQAAPWLALAFLLGAEVRG